jgi:hypothetical protein
MRLRGRSVGFPAVFLREGEADMGCRCVYQG